MNVRQNRTRGSANDDRAATTRIDADQRLDPAPTNSSIFRTENIGCEPAVRRLRFAVHRRSASDTNLFSADAADTALALSISSSAEMIEDAKSGRARPTRASNTMTSSSATPATASTTPARTLRANDDETNAPLEFTLEG